jgi:hypothetical protein
MLTNLLHVDIYMRNLSHINIEDSELPLSFFLCENSV